MSSKHFMAVALWILATAAVAADKPPQASLEPCSCKGAKPEASQLIQYFEHMLEQPS